MIELKVSNKKSDQSFGWVFPTKAEANEFLAKIQSDPRCPYAPIIERDVDGNVVSETPNPEWDIQTSEYKDEGKAKDDATVLVREELKQIKNLVTEAKKADTVAKQKVVITAMAEMLVSLSKIVGTSDILEAKPE